jgi:hypothetical protein
MLRQAMIVLTLLMPAVSWGADDGSDYLVLAAAGNATLQGKPVNRGMAIPAAAVLVLPVGSSITVIGERGKFVMNGAFEGAIDSTPAPAANASDPPFGFLVSLLMRVLPFAELRGGGVSGGELWAIRPDTPGVKCMIDGRPPSLEIDAPMI